MSTIFVFGTGTEVGKTWTLVRVLAALRGGDLPLAVRKPAQSYAPDEAGHTDAELLAGALGVDPYDVCPAHRWFATPMAPPMAADALGAPRFTIADLAAETPRPPAPGLLFVEGAGGPRSPLAVDGDNVDLARAVGARLAILVADAGLGTINAVRLSVDALAGLDTLVALNRFDPAHELHRRNHDWLVAAGCRVTAGPDNLAAAVLERVP
jgi:dethiobiotin synthetase